MNPLRPLASLCAAAICGLLAAAAAQAQHAPHAPHTPAAAPHGTELLLGAGAGYRRPVTALLAQFRQDTGIQIDQIYGHIGSILGQARQTGQIAVIVGDRAVIEKAEGVAVASYVELGDGRLVVAWPRNQKLAAAADLREPRFARIALPDTKAAIYGIAASQFLERSGLAAAVKDRLQVLPTVPQVTAYLVSGEIDAGFVNLTEVLAVQDRIGGYLEIDPALYAPVKIVAAVLKGHETQPAVQKLLAFLQTPSARAILAQHGL